MPTFSPFNLGILGRLGVAGRLALGESTGIGVALATKSAVLVAIAAAPSAVMIAPGQLVSLTANGVRTRVSCGLELESQAANHEQAIMVMSVKRIFL